MSVRERNPKLLNSCYHCLLCVSMWAQHCKVRQRCQTVVIMSSCLFLASVAVTTPCKPSCYVYIFTHFLLISKKSTDVTLVQISLSSTFQFCSIQFLVSWPKCCSLPINWCNISGYNPLQSEWNTCTLETIAKCEYFSSILFAGIFLGGTLMLQQPTSRWCQHIMKNHP